MTPPKTEQKEGHGYCTKCGKEVQPIMECKCEFRNKTEQNISLDDKILAHAYPATHFGGERVVPIYRVKEIVTSLLDTMIAEAEVYKNQFDGYRHATNERDATHVQLGAETAVDDLITIITKYKK